MLINLSKMAQTGVVSPRNILDNSDFTKPVNQRRLTSYYERNSKYTIDRWKTAGSVAVCDGYVDIENISENSEATGIYQYFEMGTLTPGKMYTAALMLDTGLTIYGTGVAVDGAITTIITNVSPTNPVGYDSDINFQIASNYSGSDHFAIRLESKSIGSAFGVIWVALYEGEYTASTLPKYQPKGYAAELLECQRYYYQCSSYTAFYGYKSSSAYCFIQLPVIMRTTPTVTIEGLTVYGTADEQRRNTECTINTVYYGSYGNMIRLLLDCPNMSDNQAIICVSDGLKISADL